MFGKKKKEKVKAKDKFLELKVYKNKKTGQRTVILPKKIIKKDLKKVKISW